MRFNLHLLIINFLKDWNVKIEVLWKNHQLYPPVNMIADPSPTVRKGSRSQSRDHLSCDLNALAAIQSSEHYKIYLASPK